MTVKELKEILANVPDDVEVTALKGGVYCERADVWSARYENYEETDEDGNSDLINRFTIHC